MTENLFRALVTCLRAEPTVVATVIQTRGAVPRLAGTRMLITATQTHFTIGGGKAENEVMARSQNLLMCESGIHEDLVEIDLTGRELAHGICGGRMWIALRRWHGAEDLARARVISDSLSRGETVALQANEIGPRAVAEMLEPNPCIMIIGGGHCGAALASLAQTLDFDVHVFDSRDSSTVDAIPALSCAITRWHGDATILRKPMQSKRDHYVVLLNRDYHADVDALRVLCEFEWHYLGMMGSRKRIQSVLAALPEFTEKPTTIHAPIGLEIGAQSPAEIAISILAEIIQCRANRKVKLDSTPIQAASCTDD